MANYKDYIARYPKPREIPVGYFDDGIYIVDYGDIYMTPAHVVHTVEDQRKFEPNKKLPIMVMAEAAGGLSQGMLEVTSSEATESITKAAALVSRSKLTTILANMYLSVKKATYPTKLFTDEAEARAWLEQYKEKEEAA